MKKTSYAFHIDAAFLMLLYDLKEENVPKSKWPKITDKFINLDKYGYSKENAEEVTKNFRGIKGTALGYTSVPAGSNNNKTKSSITNYPVKGDKKWETQYYAVLDRKDSKEEVPGSRTSIKKDCIDTARAITDETGRPTFIIITKVPVGFDQVSAEINFVAKDDQDLGEFIFVW